MGLVLGPLDSTILIMVKETQGNKRDPGALIVTNTVNQEKGGSKLIVNFARYCFHHPSSMSDGKEPKGSWHLLFSEVRMGHMDHALPMQFNEDV